jgi:hypothetical protein
MKILETVRDEKDLQTKNNALLYIMRKHKWYLYPIHNMQI